VVPTTYIIDRQGKVTKRIQGKRSAEEFRTLIKKSL
jgi:glutathione peroxidase-family protein